MSHIIRLPFVLAVVTALAASMSISADSTKTCPEGCATSEDCCPGYICIDFMLTDGLISSVTYDAYTSTCVTDELLK
ncbi:hypothetical protein EDB19DRAFT_1735171 [Suillus lakei]|nr:hypothetical protein EDB19DRAFT_1735171 [Suillus lakei]